ncbi:Esterase, SGNH hydrolase-type [Metarhizium album ARSEF 1941]|uniref:Esterase, SGNH hydrolase-type n=1 Tax=Metarhizium album (strain ARSEF 1941) TaxID=1081103 RepID=A0A0B2X2K0_METAS|nr:Esterase, SGNH hydrolase-type [Metarhizium album ARSEF 1941]KHN99967.1 Esterase, SGNH hydrolase-type [Metarhizium album ARSEF 1941]
MAAAGSAQIHIQTRAQQGGFNRNADMSPPVQSLSLSLSRLAVAGLALVTTGICNLTLLAAPRATTTATRTTTDQKPSPARAPPASMPRGEATRVKVALRLMPLGASITYGQGSSTGNGYRGDLHDLLTSNGYAVGMVGSRRHGSMEDNAVEGWPGFLIHEVRSKAEAAVPSRLPNVFLVNAGTNDCAVNLDLDAAGRRIDRLLEYLWTASPGSTVILSTLLVNLSPPVEARVGRVNAQIEQVAEDRAAQGKRIVLVDMHAADAPQAPDMADATHPNDAGYSKMAAIWLRGIQEAAAKGFLNEPKPVPGA